MTITLVDLFSGVGGLSLGVAQAAKELFQRETEVSLAVEKDETIAKVYWDNFPVSHAIFDVCSVFSRDFDAPVSDTEKRTKSYVRRVDFLVGGPPCQGRSHLNNHTRGEDPKNEMYLTMTRAARVLEPRCIIIENVTSLAREELLDISLQRLVALGYKVDHGVVDASDVGVPQRRKRHVLLAHRDEQPSVEAAVDAFRTPLQTVRMAIEDLVEKHGTTPFDTAAVMSRENVDRAKYLLDHDLYDLPNAMRPPCQQGRHRYVAMYGRLSWDLPSPTITTGFGSPGKGRFLHPSEPRTLTPHEAARIQSFPDSFDFSLLSYSTDLARAIGNAVPPRLAFVLAHHLLDPPDRVTRGDTRRPRSPEVLADALQTSVHRDLKKSRAARAVRSR